MKPGTRGLPLLRSNFVGDINASVAGTTLSGNAAPHLSSFDCGRPLGLDLPTRSLAAFHLCLPAHSLSQVQRLRTNSLTAVFDDGKHHEADARRVGFPAVPQHAAGHCAATSGMEELGMSKE